MKATFQPIPKHLLEKPEVTARMQWLIYIFQELNRERTYLAFGEALPLPTSKIEERLYYYGFEGYKVEELKTIILQMDTDFRDYDTSQLEHTRKQSNKPT